MAELIAGIGDGVPLRQLCRIHKVSKSTVYRWMEEDPSFAGRIAHARVLGFDALAEEALEIADDASNDYVEREKGKAFDPEHVQRSKLRVETRLKLLAKWDPKRYGEKLDVTSGGKEIDAAPQVTIFTLPDNGR